ncbi:hypothetical protein DSO57_1015062 [Entomophthora muscae]|uniref:Uncharacterized protein n=1 Tax=Entomophthora muscae TaxID=34485 RepID=A0ACC2SI53_9FUNG|nr:hypothetical protein DSO57_1015062 [Entomophthora muscae]
MKNTSSLEVWHKHLKVKFGSNPKYNKFFQKLQEEQAQTVSKFCDLANQVAPKKRKEQDNQEDVQKVFKKKHKVAETKKHLRNVGKFLRSKFLRSKVQKSKHYVGCKN